MEKENSVKIERIPHDASRNYEEDFVEERREWIRNKTKTKLNHISHYSIKPEDAKGNIENFIGIAQVPLGILGPLKVNGKFANDIFYVPFATTEGAVLTTFQRGAIAITKAGGAKTSIRKDENHLDPVFILKNLEDAEKFIQWTNDNFDILSDKVKEVTGHGKLLAITPYIIGKMVALRVSYYTQDAMGANMIGIATDLICQFISKQYKVERYLLRSNLSSEKKASGVNMLIGCGKELLVEAILPRKIVNRHLNSSPEAIHNAWHAWTLGSVHANMIGGNAHFANGIAAIFIACGQDVAHVSNASVGITIFDITESGDLYTAVKLPNILIGTVGGGTALGTQRECLEIIGCYGQGKSKKFAEIIGATLLAGEIGICAGITSDEFLKPHIEARVHTREKAFEQK
jgi:hydroxymethylglutaryl-CoA reductase (NADPH)